MVGEPVAHWSRQIDRLYPSDPDRSACRRRANNLPYGHVILQNHPEQVGDTGTRNVHFDEDRLAEMSVTISTSAREDAERGGAITEHPPQRLPVDLLLARPRICRARL